MNINNVKIAIAIMERAGKVDMRSWQSNSKGNAHTDEKKLHKCGTTACFAGWVAVSPEWQEFGKISSDGAPELNNLDTIDNFRPAYALSKWFELEEKIVNLFVYGDIISDLEIDCEYNGETVDGKFYSIFYDKQWSKVKAKDVIEKLNILLQENGVLKILKQYKKDIKPYIDNNKLSSYTAEKITQITEALIKKHSAI